MYKLDLSPRMIVRDAEVGPVEPTPFGRERADELENLALSELVFMDESSAWTTWWARLRKYMRDGEIAYVYAILDALKGSMKIDDYRSILDENKLVAHAFMLIQLNSFDAEQS